MRSVIFGVQTKTFDPIQLSGVTMEVLITFVYFSSLRGNTMSANFCRYTFCFTRMGRDITKSDPFDQLWKFAKNDIKVLNVIV